VRVDRRVAKTSRQGFDLGLRHGVLPLLGEIVPLSGLDAAAVEALRDLSWDDE
jgi:hypothetical protein